MDHQSIPARRQNVQVAQMGGEGVLLDPATDAVAYLSPSAMLIFALCDGQRSVGQIRQLLQDAYPEAASQITTDIAASLAELKQAGMIDF